MEKYHIFCDESGIVQENYMIIGGIILPSYLIKDVNKKIQLIKDRHNKSQHEIKFEKIDSHTNLALYSDIFCEIFLKHKIDFRCCTFDTRQINHSRYNKTSFEKTELTSKKERNEQGFNKLYYTMLYHQFIKNKKQTTFSIYLDERPSLASANVKIDDLRTCLNVGTFNNLVPIVKYINSKSSDYANFIQLADLLCGIVNYEKNQKVSKKDYKNHFLEKIRTNLNINVLSKTTYSGLKWKVWNVDFNNNK